MDGRTPPIAPTAVGHHQRVAVLLQQQVAHQVSCSHRKRGRGHAVTCLDDQVKGPLRRRMMICHHICIFIDDDLRRTGGRRYISLTREEMKVDLADLLPGAAVGAKHMFRPRQAKGLCRQIGCRQNLFEKMYVVGIGKPHQRTDSPLRHQQDVGLPGRARVVKRQHPVSTDQPPHRQNRMQVSERPANQRTAGRVAGHLHDQLLQFVATPTGIFLFSDEFRIQFCFVRRQGGVMGDRRVAGCIPGAQVQHAG